MRAIIVAFADKNRAIGWRGQIPWMGKMRGADLPRVKKLTTGNVIIMGLNTFHSIGKPLPNRENIVLSDETKFRETVAKDFPEVVFANSLDDAFAKVPDNKIAFIFGGATVYREAMARAKELNIDEIFATEIHGEFDGDTFFPEISRNIWHEISREDFAKDDKNAFPYSFVTYSRK